MPRGSATASGLIAIDPQLVTWLEWAGEKGGITAAAALHDLLVAAGESGWQPGWRLRAEEPQAATSWQRRRSGPPQADPCITERERQMIKAGIEASELKGVIVRTLLVGRAGEPLPRGWARQVGEMLGLTDERIRQLHRKLPNPG